MAAAATGLAPSVNASAALEVFRLPALSDNYIWLLREPSSGATAVVDPADAAPVVAEVARRGWGTLDYILNTHHHADHTGGNLELKRRFPGLQVWGGRVEAAAAKRARRAAVCGALDRGAGPQPRAQHFARAATPASAHQRAAAPRAPLAPP